MDRTPYSVMAKPAGSKCNMRCSYCYYLGKNEKLGQTPQARMSDETLEVYIRQYLESTTGPNVSFVWHGGEPTLAGIDFYQKVITLQKKYCPKGWQCWNNLQTNGLLLDEEWCRFLAENHFDVGLSLDGTQAVHDQNRLDSMGQGSFDRVYSTAKRLMRYGIHPDLLCTVNAETVKHPLEVYNTLKSLSTGWIQFIPIVCRDETGAVTENSISPEEYGIFLNAVFDEWLLHDMHSGNIQLFAETARILSGGQAGLCWMAPTCGKVPVVEQDGSVYSCDHFVERDFRIGRIPENCLSTLVNTPEQLAFGNQKKKLTRQCQNCNWLSFCNGACPKDRFADSKEGEPGHYYLCEGLNLFFTHAVPRLKEVLELRRRGESSLSIMAKLREAEQQKWKGVGRNDPCPCGSGKKAKNCCWNKRP